MQKVFQYANMGIKAVILLAIAIFVSSCSQKESPVDLLINKTKRKLTVNISGVLKFDSIIIRLHSDRNTKISYRSEKSQYHPNGALPANISEVWYPVVDVELENQSKGVAVFDEDISGNYSINGMFYKEIEPLNKMVLLDSKNLLFWE